ncbi:MAG TPA: hypothetical protein V6D47_21515 [Oscillatoriaceae cyanobacterium]
MRYSAHVARRLIPALLAGTALTGFGCSGASPVAPTEPTVSTGTNALPPSTTPPSATQPTKGPTTAPTTPAATSSPSTTTGPIQLLDLPSGAQTSFVTRPGSQLTVVASAATDSPPASAFRLSVNGATTANTASAYSLKSTTSFPFRSSFTQTNAALLKHTRHVLDTTTTTAQPARTIGSTDQFWINSGDSTTNGDYQETCVLKAISPHAYFYVDQAATNFTDAQVQQLVDQFENQIYARETAVFGEPDTLSNLPDNKLFIVISPAVDDFGKARGVMGYFWSRDVLPDPAPDQHSNQKKAVFMTDQLFNYPALTSFGTMAHEFQHLINFSHKAVNTDFSVAEDTWLDEGMAMYAMEVAGYGLPAGDGLIAKDLDGFEQNPSKYSLTDWSANPNGFAYGQSYLFVRYLADRFGQGVIKQLIDSPTSGEDSIQAITEQHGETFGQFFRDWTVTNLINGTPLARGTVYNYNNLDLAGNYAGYQLHGFQTMAGSSTNLTANLLPWGTAYYRFNAPQPQSWSFSLGDGGSSALTGAALVP